MRLPASDGGALLIWGVSSLIIGGEEGERPRQRLLRPGARRSLRTQRTVRSRQLLVVGGLMGKVQGHAVAMAGSPHGVWRGLCLHVEAEVDLGSGGA